MLAFDFRLTPFNGNRQLTMLYFINMHPLVFIYVV